MPKRLKNTLTNLIMNCIYSFICIKCRLTLPNSAKRGQPPASAETINTIIISQQMILLLQHILQSNLLSLKVIFIKLKWWPFITSNGVLFVLYYLIASESDAMSSNDHSIFHLNS